MASAYNPMAGCERRKGANATPGCDCRYCTSVFLEWAEWAQGFQRWFDELDHYRLGIYFGLERKPALLATPAADHEGEAHDAD